MADENNTASAESRYSEILSPSELFAARSRSHKIPVRGQKDFFPNDSDEQRQRLEQSLSEHWSLISEERVERLGNLVKATWIPSDQVVELQSPAGKFWQTMGFSAQGKQYLLPEEALYLMECGNLQVFYQDLPLSIQDGYERFLSSNSVSLLQYQLNERVCQKVNKEVELEVVQMGCLMVFGHLKRLGYVVHRFDSSTQPSMYARQLNLPPSRTQLKRKRSVSPAPTPTSSHTEKQDSTTEMMELDKKEEDRKPLESHSTASPETLEVQLSTTSTTDEDGGRTWWAGDVLHYKESNHSTTSTSSRWDFSSISFPDVGSREHLSDSLASPDPSLLPGGLAVGICDVTTWKHKINQRKVVMSSKEQKREDDKQRRRWDINKDREVQQCRNWTEYQELMARRQTRCEGRPAHLWNREVTPLHDPRQPLPTRELLEKISVIESMNLLEGTSRLKESDEWRICFSVYQPDSVGEFKKSNPGKPYSHMCVCSFDGPVPDLRAIKLLASQSGDVPVVFAVVDYGDISFYTFKDFQLPLDVYP